MEEMVEEWREALVSSVTSNVEICDAFARLERNQTLLLGTRAK